MTVFWLWKAADGGFAPVSVIPDGERRPGGGDILGTLRGLTLASEISEVVSLVSISVCPERNAEKILSNSFNQRPSETER